MAHENLQDKITTALKTVLAHIGKNAANVSILRNGGWELWFRSLLLVELDALLGSLAITASETKSKGSTRADIEIYCLPEHPNHPICVIELKTNYVAQGNESTRQLKKAVSQVEGYDANETFRLVIHAFAHLLHSGSDYATRHNEIVQTLYKKIATTDNDPVEKLQDDIRAHISNLSKKAAKIDWSTETIEPITLLEHRGIHAGIGVGLFTPKDI